MSWFPGINGRPGIVTADWLMTRGNTISNGSEYVTKIQAAKNILLTPTADAKASELVADIARLGQALRGGVAVAAAPQSPLFANPEQPAAPQGELSEAARPLAGSVSSGNPAAAVAVVPSAERAAAADSARAAAAAAAQPQPEEGAPAAAAQPEEGAPAAAAQPEEGAPAAAAPGAEESRGALNSSVFGPRRGGRHHQTPKRRRSGRNGLSKKRRHTGK